MLTQFRLSPLIAATVLWPSCTQLAFSAAPGTDGLSLDASDWPWWRGTQRDGIVASQALPLEWSETENVLWKAAIPGRGHGSPIIVGERVFLATADEEKQSQYVICLDRDSGNTLGQADPSRWWQAYPQTKYASFIHTG